jgi:DnaJ like chaperone protein
VATLSSSWGKIIGGTLGLFVGGPFGAAVGLTVGHMHDKNQKRLGSSGGWPGHGWSGLWGDYGSFAGNVEQAAFTMGVVVLSAKMAKADGRVTRAEIEAFKRVFNIAPSQETAIGLLFDRARLSADGFEPYAFQLAHVYRRNSTVLEEILSGLFIIGAADSVGLSQAEITFLKRVAYIFGFSNQDFARIAARSGVGLPEAEKPHDPVGESYAILGVNATATHDEIKTAYRALIREHHPDK